MNAGGKCSPQGGRGRAQGRHAPSRGKISQISERECRTVGPFLQVSNDIRNWTSGDTKNWTPLP
jgi:hypothetical protein